MHRLFDHSLTALPRCPTVCVCLCVSNASRLRRRAGSSQRGSSRSGKQGEKEKQIRLLPILPTERPVFQGRVTQPTRACIGVYGAVER